MTAIGKESLFIPMAAEDFTTLKITYDWKTDSVRLFMKKEWESGFDFTDYNHSFFVDSVLTAEEKYLNHQEVLDLFARYDLTNYLFEVIDRIRKGRHFAVECYFHKNKNLRFISNQHNRTLGINSRYYALLAGGIRRHPLEEAEIDVIQDGLNLGRAMSLKNVVAQVPFGGVKITLHSDPVDLTDFDTLGFLAFSMDRTKTFTSPDMNVPVEISDIINEKYSVQYIGGRKMPLGTTGKPTAYGLYLSLKQAAKFRYGSESLTGKSVVLQGLGEVGWFVAEHLLSENVHLAVSDINQETIEKLVRKHKDKNIQVIPPEKVLSSQADILCPCAKGAIFDESNIPDLHYTIVFGAANNQIIAESDEEEIQIADLFAENNILFQTDFVQNAAGVICGAASYIYGKSAQYDKLLATIEQVMPQATWNNLTEAAAKGITPTENIYRYCEKALFDE